MTRQLPPSKWVLSFLPSLLVFTGLLFGLTHSLNAQLQATFAVTEPICFGLPNGSITATASGGVPNYAYFWSNGQTGPTAAGLVAGTYSVTIADASGQNIIRSVLVNQPALVTVVLTPDELCNAPFNITATPGGGISPYNYNWSTGAMTPTIINVPAGQYCVTVTDSNLCGAVECITVSANPAGVSVQANNVTCPGGTNGSVTATPIGGLPPYSYSWSNGGTGQVISGLSGGTYTVTLTDANGCTAVASGFVNQPPPIVINLTPTSPTCPGDTNGSITSNISGGTPPYTWVPAPTPLP
jgi:hypothetical protein